MTAQAPATTDWTERMARLEHRNQRLTGVVVLLVLIALAQTAWQFLPPPEVITARSFRLQGPKGPPRGELVMWHDGTPAFRLNNEYGQARALWALRPDGTASLRMNDGRLVTRIEMLVDPAGQPRVLLANREGQGRVNLGVSAEGRAFLQGIER